MGWEDVSWVVSGCCEGSGNVRSTCHQTHKRLLSDVCVWSCRNSHRCCCCCLVTDCSISLHVQATLSCRVWTCRGAVSCRLSAVPAQLCSS